MDALLTPVERAVEGGEWFVRNPSLRFCYVATSTLVRASVLEHFAASEMLDTNGAPFFVLESPCSQSNDGWTSRTEELRAAWSLLVESAPPPGLPPLWAPLHGAPGPGTFTRELGKALESIRTPITGLVVVMAPRVLEDVAGFLVAVETLVRSRHYEKARFALLETDTDHGRMLLERLGASAMEIDARLDDAALRAMTAARMEAMKVSGADARGIASTGAAGPTVVPPPRKGQVDLEPQQRRALAKEGGVPPAFFDLAAMQGLRVGVMAAAMAMRDGKTTDAVREQRQVRDFCAKSEMPREAVIHELVLAGYVLQGGSPQGALELFGAAKRRAVAGGFSALAVQAQMGVASCLLLLQQPVPAISAYLEAGAMGEKERAEILAVEAYRTAGQVLVTQGRTQEGATAFRAAIRVAEGGGEEALRNSTANEAMRALAKLCRKHGLNEQAAALEAQALVLESEAEQHAERAAEVG